MSLATHNQAIQCTTADQLFIDDKGGLRSTRFDDIYFYPNKGAEETQHVFLNGNQLAQRWSQHPQNSFVIAETGFGTGLNFLASWDLWLRSVASASVSKQPTLYYYSTERFPLSRAAFEKVLKHYNPYPELAAQLLARYPDPVGGDYLLDFTNASGHAVKLVLLFGDSTEALSRLEHYPGSRAQSLMVDAWFLDGFAPSRNPDMWQQQLFSSIEQHSHQGSTLATFSAARQVREQLAQHGFSAHKTPGYGNKRDMLVAEYTGTDTATNTRQTPSTLSPCYFRYADKKPSDANAKTAVIIGAGIAGCTIAYQLAHAGWQLTIVDSNDSIAAAASGNSRAILYARTALQRSALSDFHEAAFHYAVPFYRRLFGHKTLSTQSCPDNQSNIGLNGMIKLGETVPDTLLQANTDMHSRQTVNAEQASALAGVDLSQGGIHYPESGWLDPVATCEALCNHPAIHFSGNTAIKTLQQTDNGWRIDAQNGQVLNAGTVVIACGQHSQQFALTQWLPLKSLRGQTSQIPATDQTRALKIALCQRGYITPMLNNSHEIGATYSTTEKNHALKATDQHENIANLCAMLVNGGKVIAESGTQTASALTGRVGFRCVAPDYLPIVGPMVALDEFNLRFAGLSKNARQTPDEYACLHKGLYVSTAFGSHGFTTAPLAAEILLAQIVGTAIPIGDKLRQSIAPARFLVRKLIRGK